MLKNKPVYNYDIEECNKLFKKGVCKSESHDKSNHGIFCVTGNDSGYIDIEDLD